MALALLGLAMIWAIECDGQASDWAREVWSSPSVIFYAAGECGAAFLINNGEVPSSLEPHLHSSSVRRHPTQDNIFMRYQKHD